jgi:hypothetical protein
MTTKEHRQTATIVGPEGRESQVEITSENLLTADEIQDLVTQSTTTPGCPAEPIQVAAVDPEKPRTPASEITERLGLLKRCQVITREGRAFRFMGISNTKACRFAALSAPSVQEIGYMIGDIIARISLDCSAEEADAFVEAVSDAAHLCTSFLLSEGETLSSNISSRQKENARDF